MIDIHTHILPHFDDGAKDTATSLAMLNAESGQGVDTVVLTSHYYGKKRSPKQYIEKRTEIFEKLRPQIPENVQLRLGAEVHFTGLNMAEFEELCLLAIEGTEYILIEFPFTAKWESSLFDTLSDFIADTGYTPIIAHAERYENVRKKPSLIAELVQMGCLIQVNARSFLQKEDKGLALALLKRGFVHCIGSDAHNTEGRAPDMLTAKEELEKLGFSTEWQRAQEIMQEVLAGGQVRVECGKPVKKFLGKYF